MEATWLSLWAVAHSKGVHLREKTTFGFFLDCETQPHFISLSWVLNSRKSLEAVAYATLSLH
jgi:hypothetical protein